MIRGLVQLCFVAVGLLILFLQLTLYVAVPVLLAVLVLKLVGVL